MRFYCNSTLFYIIINISAYPDVKRGRLATYPDLTIYVRGEEVTTMVTWALFFACGSFIVGLLRLFLATLEFVMKLQKRK